MTEVFRLGDLLGRGYAIMDVSHVFSVGQEISVEEDALLVKKIQKGESQLFEQLVDRYTDKMFRYLYYYFNLNGQLAEDVVQEIFIKLWSKLAKYDHKQSFQAWFYRFAHNCTIDWIRKHEKDERLQGFSHVLGENDESGHNFAENFVISDENIIDNANVELKQQLLTHLMSHLEGKYKDVLLLFYFEQKTYEEIAYILDIKVAHVGTLLLRGKQKLRALIEQDVLLKDAVIFDL